MKLSIDQLRAAGVSDKQIVDALREAEATRREQNRIAQRNHRSRQQERADRADRADTSLSFKEEEDQEKQDKKARKGVRGKPTTLPDDWQPKGPQRDPTEADEFREMCRSKGRTYVDFDAAYRQFQRSQYNARNKNGGSINHDNLAAAKRTLGLQMHQQGASPDEIQRAWDQLDGRGRGTDHAPEFRFANVVAWQKNQKL